MPIQLNIKFSGCQFSLINSSVDVGPGHSSVLGSQALKYQGNEIASCNVNARKNDNREVKIPRFLFTDTGDIHVPVSVNRGTTCHLRNSRYSGVRKPIGEW